MNGIHTASDKFDMILYADDTNLISPLCSFNSSFSGTKNDVKRVSEQINIELTNIQEWLNINELSLSVRKTKYMIFHYYERNITNISPTLKMTLGIMCRLKKCLPTDILRISYNSLILPHLQYWVLFWCFEMGRLDKLQKRAVLIISNSRYNSHTDPLFKKLIY